MAQREFTCVVNAAGPSDQQNPFLQHALPIIYLTLTDLGGSFKHDQFYAVDSCKNEMLAVALAAISTQSQVRALLDVDEGREEIKGAGFACHQLFIVAS